MVARTLRGVALPLMLLLALALGALPSAAGAAPVSAGAARPAARFAAAPAIVGGTVPGSTADAPWQVFVQARVAVPMGTETFSCGGSILDATHVLTAGHCVYDENGTPFTSSEFVVRAGSPFVDTGNPAGTPGAGETAFVQSVAVHPRYDVHAPNEISPDDVAILTLVAPLDLDGTNERAAQLVGENAYPAAGTSAQITGYGLTAFGGEQDGNLRETTTTIGDPFYCGGDANALYDCVSSPTSSACLGDSGGPLTIGGALAGVASFVGADGAGECTGTSTNGYTNLAAPEIGEWIRRVVAGQPADVASLPEAPRGGDDIGVYAPGLNFGDALTCIAGTWTASPSFTYTFFDGAPGQALQSGSSPVYVLSPADVGRQIGCLVTATAPGGTGISYTTTLPAVGPAVATTPPGGSPPSDDGQPVPTPPARQIVTPKLKATGRANRKSGVARGTVTYTLRITNSGGATAQHVSVCLALAGGQTVASRPRGAKIAKARACWSIAALKPRGAAALSIRVRMPATRRKETVTSRVTVTSKTAKAHTSATVRLVVKPARARR